MKDPTFRSLQAFLWMICAFHVTVGLGLNVSGDFPRLMAKYYGAQVDWTGQFVYILKPLGAFMFVLGLLAAVAALDPLKHRAIAYGFVAVFIIRALQRAIFRQDIHDAFAIAPARNLTALGFFLVLGITLFVLHRYVEKRASAAG